MRRRDRRTCRRTLSWRSTDAVRVVMLHIVASVVAIVLVCFLLALLQCCRRCTVATAVTAAECNVGCSIQHCCDCKKRWLLLAAVLLVLLLCYCPAAQSNVVCCNQHCCIVVAIAKAFHKGLQYCRESALYCRESALQDLMTTGSPDQHHQNT